MSIKSSSSSTGSTGGLGCFGCSGNGIRCFGESDGRGVKYGPLRSSTTSMRGPVLPPITLSRVTLNASNDGLIALASSLWNRSSDL